MANPVTAAIERSHVVLLSSAGSNKASKCRRTAWDFFDGSFLGLWCLGMRSADCGTIKIERWRRGIAEILRWWGLRSYVIVRSLFFTPNNSLSR